MSNLTLNPGPTRLKAAGALHRAAEWVRSGPGHEKCPGCVAKGAFGEIVQPNDPSAEQWCAMGRFAYEAGWGQVELESCMIGLGIPSGPIFRPFDAGFFMQSAAAMDDIAYGLERSALDDYPPEPERSALDDYPPEPEPLAPGVVKEQVHGYVIYMSTPVTTQTRTHAKLTAVTIDEAPVSEDSWVAQDDRELVPA